MRECEAVHDVEWEIRLLKRCEQSAEGNLTCKCSACISRETPRLVSAMLGNMLELTAIAS